MTARELDVNGEEHHKCSIFPRPLLLGPDRGSPLQERRAFNSTLNHPPNRFL